MGASVFLLTLIIMSGINGGEECYFVVAAVLFLSGYLSGSTLETFGFGKRQKAGTHQ